MGYPFHLGDTLWSALKSLKPIIFAIALLINMDWSLQNERRTAHVLICGCQDDMQHLQPDQDCDASE